MAALQATDNVQEIDQRMRVASDLVCSIRDMHTPVIAAVNGAAAGAGMNLALACDLRFASSNAEFAQSFVRIGLIPDWGGHYLLTRLVGPARALEIMWGGERMPAAEACRLGLVNEVFEADEFEVAVRLRAQRLAQGPRHALGAIKRGVELATHASLREVLDYERETQTALFLGAEARAGISAFVDKRAPEWPRR